MLQPETIWIAPESYNFTIEKPAHPLAKQSLLIPHASFVPGLASHWLETAIVSTSNMVELPHSSSSIVVKISGWLSESRTGANYTKN
jgi:hypothetical protein